MSETSSSCAAAADDINRLIATGCAKKVFTEDFKDFKSKLGRGKTWQYTNDGSTLGGFKSNDVKIIQGKKSVTFDSAPFTSIPPVGAPIHQFQIQHDLPPLTNDEQLGYFIEAYVSTDTPGLNPVPLDLVDPKVDGIPVSQLGVPDLVPNKASSSYDFSLFELRDSQTGVEIEFLMNATEIAICQGRRDPPPGVKAGYFSHCNIALRKQFGLERQLHLGLRLNRDGSGVGYLIHDEENGQKRYVEVGRFPSVGLLSTSTPGAFGGGLDSQDRPIPLAAVKTEPENNITRYQIVINNSSNLYLLIPSFDPPIRSPPNYGQGARSKYSKLKAYVVESL